LDPEVITYKTITNHNQARNTENSLASRAEWAEWFLGNQHYPFVYVDEFGFNLATQRNCARSRRGQPAIHVAPANRGENVSVAVVIQRWAGIVCHRVSETAFHRRSFNEFMEELIGPDISHRIPHFCHILDNWRNHQDLDLGDPLEITGGILTFLPPENSMFNPIEEVFADLKRSIQTSLSTMMHVEVLRTQNLPWGEKAGGRR
jgi:hypothetical protein